MSFDCLIVGAGPAGLTAALYLQRFHRRVRVQDAGASRVHAIGRSHNLPRVPGAEALRRAGRLRQCPICDGHEWRDRRIVVVGEGAHGEAEARFIGHYSDDVTLLAPAQVQRFGFDRGRVQVQLASHVLEADVVYAALGVRPRNALAQALGATLDERGAIVTDAHGRTGVPGLWAAGDVVSALDQIAVATGHGAVAATSIHNALGM